MGIAGFFLGVVMVIPDSGVFAGFVILVAMRLFLQAGVHGRGAILLNFFVSAFWLCCELSLVA